MWPASIAIEVRSGSFSRSFFFCIVSSATRRLACVRLLCCRAGPHGENFFFLLFSLQMYFFYFSGLRVRGKKSFIFWFYENTVRRRQTVSYRQMIPIDWCVLSIVSRAKYGVFTGKKCVIFHVVFSSRWTLFFWFFLCLRYFMCIDVYHKRFVFRAGSGFSCYIGKRPAPIK